MAADKKQLAADCFRRGNEAMGKENWDYAIQMFSQAVRLVPDTLLFRQTLRGCQEKKYGNNKTGAKMAGMKLMGPRGKLKKAQLKKDWAAADAAAEEGLAINPWDAQLSADLGEALKHQEFFECATFAYEKAVTNDSNNKAFLRELAEMYEHRGDFILASGLWDRIVKIDPMDGDARTRSQHAATKNVNRKFDHKESTKEVMSDQEIARRLGKHAPGEADGPGQSEEADLQRATRKEPDNKDNFIRLGDFYRRNGKLEEAREAYVRALELSGNDANIREQMEDVELAIMRRNIELASEKAGNSDEGRAKVKALDVELLKRETAVLSARVERYPADMRLKLRLGECFMKTGQYVQAIPMFQQAAQDNRVEVQALTALGKCFMKEKKYALAKRQFEKALPSLNPLDHEELYLEANYWLGRLSEASGDNDAADKYYTDVLGAKWGYRDAAERQEKIQGGDDAAAFDDV